MAIGFTASFQYSFPLTHKVQLVPVWGLGDLLLLAQVIGVGKGSINVCHIPVFPSLPVQQTLKRKQTLNLIPQLPTLFFSAVTLALKPSWQFPFSAHAVSLCTNLSRALTLGLIASLLLPQLPCSPRWGCTLSPWCGSFLSCYTLLTTGTRFPVSSLVASKWVFVSILSRGHSRNLSDPNHKSVASNSTLSRLPCFPPQPPPETDGERQPSLPSAASSVSSTCAVQPSSEQKRGGGCPIHCEHIEAFLSLFPKLCSASQRFTGSEYLHQTHPLILYSSRWPC